MSGGLICTGSRSEKRADRPAMARVVVRDDGRLVIGFNDGLLQPGHVYDVVKDGGVVLLEDLGVTHLTARDWSGTPDALVALGPALILTAAERTP